MRKLLFAVVVVCAFAAFGVYAGAAGATPTPQPIFSSAVAFDVTPPLREMTPISRSGDVQPAEDDLEEAGVADTGFTGDSALQTAPATASIPAPLFTFEGIRNEDNFNTFGFRVNPPDTNGDVGRNHVVEMVNLLFSVFDKAGTKLLGPVDTGTLWSGFAIPDCTDPSGDPVVLYDQTTDHWILTQFTTRHAGFPAPPGPEYNCIAVSVTGDPTGSYFRYAFETQPDLDEGGDFFPDYPKYGVWSNSIVMTTRDFGYRFTGYGISVYALEKNKLVAGDPSARAVQFFLDSDFVPINLIGDGLLPPDMDGSRRPMPTDSPAPVVGTQDDNFAPYGATSDALNIWELAVHWNATPTASLVLKTQLPVASLDSVYPCGGNPGQTGRDCLPQPGVAPTANNLLDILSYRQRPTFRLAYRNFGTYESLVTNQSVEASPSHAGVRWYEIRRTGGTYSLYQQGTYAPDPVHRWMGSIAQDRSGDMALGYSVVDGTSVFPGIRYTGRLAGDPLGQMTLGEGTIINGSGIQTTSNSRWGDYTSMNVDPVDDCTFYYFNEYYLTSGTPADGRPWRTRIGAFKFPSCKAKGE